MGIKVGKKYVPKFLAKRIDASYEIFEKYMPDGHKGKAVLFFKFSSNSGPYKNSYQVTYFEDDRLERFNGPAVEFYGTNDNKSFDLVKEHWYIYSTCVTKSDLYSFCEQNHIDLTCPSDEDKVLLNMWAHKNVSK